MHFEASEIVTIVRLDSCKKFVDAFCVCFSKFLSVLLYFVVCDSVQQLPRKANKAAVGMSIKQYISRKGRLQVSPQDYTQIRMKFISLGTHNCVFFYLKFYEI